MFTLLGFFFTLICFESLYKSVCHGNCEEVSFRLNEFAFARHATIGIIV